MKKLILCVFLVLPFGACEEQNGEDDGGGGGRDSGGVRDSGVVDSGGGGGDSGGGGVLSMDCTESANRQETLCSRPTWIDPGTLGSGPKVGGLPGFGAEIRGGFIDGNRLIAGVGFNTDSDRKGLIMAFDLATGDRTVISGIYTDAATGDKETGSGPKFGYPKDLAKGKDGKYYVLNSPTSADESQIISVDPATGDRALIWDWEDDQFGHCMANDRKTLADWLGGIAVADDGSFYLGISNNPNGSGIGIIKISADGKTCTPVSVSSSYDEALNTGGGVELTTGEFRSLRLINGVLWATHGITKSLFKVDLASGDRSRVSSSSSSSQVGSGPEPGAQWLAWDEGRKKFWTSGGWAGSTSSVVSVDPETGDRVKVDLSGPGGYGADSVYVHPSKPLLVIVVEGEAIALVDPTNGNSNLLSF